MRSRVVKLLVTLCQELQYHKHRYQSCPRAAVSIRASEDYAYRRVPVLCIANQLTGKKITEVKLPDRYMKPDVLLNYVVCKL